MITVLKHFLRGLGAALLLWGMLAGTASAQDKNVLESITASPQQGGKLIIRATFKQPLPGVPAGFTVANPPRIALDLPNVANGLGKSVVDVADADLRSINVVEAANRTRMVMNLTRSLNYTAALDGRALVLTVEGGAGGGAQATTGQTTRFAESVPGVVSQAIREIDFRRGDNGEGRVIVGLSSANTGIDIRTQGRNVIVDFINTNVPQNLVRRLDVADFGTPVRMVDTVPQGRNTRLVIEPRGLWEYSAYQTDTQFILEVKPVKEDPNRLVQGTQPGYAGEKLSLNFQNVEVRAVLQVIADFTGLNIITSDTVTGSLTLRLKDVPWDQALDIILQTKGLAKRKNGNVVLIAPSEELATKEKLLLEQEAQRAELEPLRTETFTLAYAKAEDVVKVLSDAQQKILSKRGSAVTDTRTNTMFVQDIASRLEEARKVITKLDVPVRQVMIEARIVIADDKFSRQLGARFGSQAGFRVGNYNVGQSGNLLNTVTNLPNNTVSAGATTIAGAQPGNSLARGPQGGQAENLNVNLPVTSGPFNTIQLGLSVLNLGNGNLVNIELSALEADNRGKVVSNPRVITADKKKAEILQGTEIPYLTASSSGATTVQFKQATLSLEVVPQITPDDNVILDLIVKKDSVGQIFAGVPSIDVKRVNTQVLAANGDTIVLGGIYEQVSRTDVSKVPFLGDLPFVGNLFKRSQKTEDKTELLIFITPKIIKDSLTASVR